MEHSNDTLLEVESLKTYFYTDEGVSRAVDGVSFSVGQSETLGIVGESGCGKSVSCLSILRLIPQPPGRIVHGSIQFNGQEILSLSEEEMRKIRGNQISMIFQEPMTSLNPVFTIGNQIIEAIVLHKNVSKSRARSETIELLHLVGIPSPDQRIDDYPHQLSGGMRQRVMIAMALSCNPSLLIADEPTTALDVTVQAQIIDLIQNLQEEFKMGVILITHDLGVIAEVANRVVVMYAGEVVESTDVYNLFSSPKHPYTSGLLKSIPKINEKVERLSVIEGSVPNPISFPSGCRFHPRCPLADKKCIQEKPVLEPKPESNHLVRCWYSS
jgi:peptide/nickel transport system ATP-binding protein/oligopeptide transport system ATP-binding protein